FGIVALVYWTLDALPAQFHKIPASVFGIGIGLMAAFHLIANLHARNLQNLAQQAPRDTVLRALQLGLADRLTGPDPTLVAEDCQHVYWLNRSFFMTYIGRPIHVICHDHPSARDPGRWWLTLPIGPSWLEVKNGSELHRYE
ncbi:MAG: hypothetical protein AAB425_14135, partial [Bdellovibrionota bacterium]